MRFRRLARTQARHGPQPGRWPSDAPSIGSALIMNRNPICGVSSISGTVSGLTRRRFLRRRARRTAWAGLIPRTEATGVDRYYTAGMGGEHRQ